MKKLFAIFTLLVCLFIFPRLTYAQSSFQNTLSQATLAVYEGKVGCTEDSCELKSRFICTATVVGKNGWGGYSGLTAGHCFEQELLNQGVNYYVSETVNEKPILRKINVIKSDNSDRYDYGTFTFTSSRSYPVIEIDTVNVPEIGDKIVNSNFSLGVVKEVSEGTVVSGIVGEWAQQKTLRRRYLVQIVFGPGASGSPIVDEKSHEIIGIVEAMFPGTQMAAIIMPTGTNFTDFLEDDSVVPQNLIAEAQEKAKKTGILSELWNFLISLFSGRQV